MYEQKVTSIVELQEYARGTLVQLPSFGEGQPFFARLRRPSMLALTKAGKIPNSLIRTANELFNGKGMNEKKDSAMADVLGVLDIIAEACFLEPTYADIKSTGIELTDEQMMAVFNYCQRGVKALEPFREQPKGDIPAGYVAEVQKNTF